MSALPTPGGRIVFYARYSTDRLGVSPTDVSRREGLTFDPVQAATVRRIHADYAAGLSSLAIAQALMDGDRGATS